MAEINQNVSAGNQALADVLEGILTDLTNIRTSVVALVTDMQSRVSDFNVLKTKLNSDGGVSDADYTQATAKTAATPITLTTTT